jgi:hypothetical protein
LSSERLTLERFTLMSPALRPATVEAIASFRRRRTKLLRRRAGIAAIIVLLLLLLVVALLDRATFMPDQWRMGLSYLGYGVAIIAAWRLALRFVKEANAEEGAAVLLEKGDPELHEKLLSAVELAHEMPGRCCPTRFSGRGSRGSAP